MNSTVKRTLACLCLLLCAALLAGCGEKKPANYRDGEYEGRSEPHVFEVVDEDDDEDSNADGYGVVKLTIKDNVITACEFATYDLDGNFKDEEYGTKRGEVANRDFYNKARKAFLACGMYAEQLVETNDIDKVDCISGATYNYHDFKDAVKDALNQAKE